MGLGRGQERLQQPLPRSLGHLSPSPESSPQVLSALLGRVVGGAAGSLWDLGDWPPAWAERLVAGCQTSPGWCAEVLGLSPQGLAQGDRVLEVSSILLLTIEGAM